MAGLPDLLTVEEAGRVCRLGRTKAYAMTREWRATGGRSGMPVRDIGGGLRVARHELEEMIGAPITCIPPEDDATDDRAEHAAPEATLEDADSVSLAVATEHASVPVTGDVAEGPRDVPATDVTPTQRSSRRRSRRDDQPTLPFAS